MSQVEKYDSDNDKLRKEIEDCYLPRRLIEIILQRGSIPENTEEHYIGVAFLDIANYSYLSKLLSSKENRLLLNGLYTAFHNILIRRGGYLNKIEGDSMMFHFGGMLDPNMEKLNSEDQLKRIAQTLFNSCIEMQRACFLFNQANDKFLDSKTTKAQKQSLSDAFAIIEAVREQGRIASSINAVFQIRIRIGASIGKVTEGNIGPPGARQWDVIGFPVIAARRMETTAPIGGFRITKEFFDILNKHGDVKSYCNRIRKEALFLKSSYKNIKDDEVFKFREIIIKEKEDATFNTYSVQVNANMPESIADQIIALLPMNELGAEMSVDLIMYHRGNHYITTEIENCLMQMGIKIRKADLLQIIFPKKHKELMEKYQSPESLEKAVESRYSLYELFEKMGQYQDIIRRKTDYHLSTGPFFNYETAMKSIQRNIDRDYKWREFRMVHQAHFFNILLPLVTSSLKNSIKEYQSSILLNLDEIE